MNDERSQRMKFVRDNISGAFQQYFIPSLEENASSDLWGFTSEKLESPAIRSYFVFAVSQYIDAEIKKDSLLPDKVFEIELPLIGELMMTVMYMDNYILDGKGGTRTIDQLNATNIHRILISRNLLKLQIEEYLYSIQVLSDEQKKMISDTMREIYTMVDLAQYWDKNSSGYAQYNDPDFQWKPISAKSEKFLSEMLFSPEEESGETLMDFIWKALKAYNVQDEKRQFIEHYFRRIALENAAFFVLWAELVMKLKGYQGKEYQQIRAFGFLYGVVSQVVNDNVDPLPAKFDPKTAAKEPEDFCADVINGLITLPTIIYFVENPDKTMTDLKKLRNQSDEALFNELRPIVAYKARPFGQILANRLPQYLNSNNKCYENLSDMKSYAFSKKFYKHFDDQKL